MDCYRFFMLILSAWE